MVTGQPDSKEAVLAALCPHMVIAITDLKKRQIEFGGCGDCGSAWITCKACNRSVDYIQYAFEE